MAFRKIISSPVMTEDEYERISQLLNIPQDTIIDDESPEVEKKQIIVDQDLFNELPLSLD
jgi:hypothetical protein